MRRRRWRHSHVAHRFPFTPRVQVGGDDGRQLRALDGSGNMIVDEVDACVRACEAVSLSFNSRGQETVIVLCREAAAVKAAVSAKQKRVEV